MKLFKNILLVVFICILIIFTVGYASQPLLNVSQSITNGNNQQVNTISYYIYKTDVSNVNGTFTTGTEVIPKIFKVVLYLCITTTILLATGIVLGFIGKLGSTFISKLVFLFALILLIIIFLIIQFGIIVSIGTSFSEDLISFNKTNTSNNYGNAYYMILSSMLIMIVNFILYCILA